MFPLRFSPFKPIFCFFLIAVVLSLPFFHAHPQVTHSDESGEHNHSAVVHTIFSPEGGNHSNSEPGHFYSENPDGSFRAAIARISSLHGPYITSNHAGLNLLWTLSEYLPLYTPESNAFLEAGDYFTPSSQYGPGFFPRGPPSPSIIYI